MMRQLLKNLMAGVCLLSASVFAQPSTGRAVTLVVPYGAGGSTDIMARVMAQYLPPISGQPTVVENRTGGGGLVGWGAVVVNYAF
jgi:tripartite-type tricarboxylate transporter receptor subunit TctC